jgi:hypothetical protein
MSQKVFMAFTHTKKVYMGLFIRPGSGPRRLDPDPTKKARIRPDPNPQQCLKQPIIRMTIEKEAEEVSD